MKKIIAFAFILICVLGLAACANAEPEIIRKTYTGEILQDSSAGPRRYAGEPWEDVSSNNVLSKGADSRETCH